MMDDRETGTGMAVPTDVEQSQIKARFHDLSARLVTLFRHLNHDGTDFSGQDLEGLDFTGASLHRVHFRGAYIRGARFDRAWVSRCQLREAADWETHVKSWVPPGVAEDYVPHRLGELFAEAPFAPELVKLPSSSPGADGEQMTNEEHAALAQERLAVAALPVTRSQHRFFLWRSGQIGDWHDEAREVPCMLDPDSAEAYLDWLNRATGGDYLVPSPALWRYAALAGQASPSDPDAPRITREHETDRLAPAPIDTQRDTGPGRLNAFGVFDAIGNVAEFVRAPAARDLNVIGGSFRQDFDTCVQALHRPPRSFNEHTVSSWAVGLRPVRIFRASDKGR
jgi:hypothetical protein